mmetsp:Transcript_31594/g.76450  ORF Transcript_31594/g.76450 Transcript_31594/m.76450 type:complete len:168 (-) Transcript_31594:639-1142(-)
MVAATAGRATAIGGGSVRGRWHPPCVRTKSATRDDEPVQEKEDADEENDPSPSCQRPRYGSKSVRGSSKPLGVGAKSATRGEDPGQDDDEEEEDISFQPQHRTQQPGCGSMNAHGRWQPARAKTARDEQDDDSQTQQTPAHLRAASKPINNRRSGRQESPPALARSV